MPPRRTFGHTWWGRAWLDALEGRAVHDPNRLPRGRTYARTARARDLTIEPGRVHARVWGSRVEPYDVVLQVRTFRPDEWDCVLDAIVARAAHAAALLDGELDPGIDADARAVDVEILPRSGELRTACSCPDWAEPCKHAAAVCYLVADALDDDPFVVLLLRGLDRAAVLGEIRARRAGAGVGVEATAATASPGDPGVVARDAWHREPGPLPTVPTAPRSGPGRPAPWPSDPPAAAPFTADGLRRLAADAAQRAWELRLGGGGAALDLDTGTDLARLAAGLDADGRRALAIRAGVTDADLAARAAAWRIGGAAGVAVLDEDMWIAPVTDMAVARDALLAAGVGPRSIRVRGNRISVGSCQLRRGRDGRWALLDKQGGRWMLTVAPVAEVDELIDEVTSR
ncbi:MAG TPA: SWIM zinc finger family protein [Acidimicrobiales bacterium]|nr:SWIM zinc finger family protein [Acidimicrobiales bacterium]